MTRSFLAYSVDYVGFRQYQLQIKDLISGELLPDTAERVTSVEWAGDNTRLFYTTEDAVTKRPNKLFRHTLGGSSELLYEETDELYDIHLGKSRDKQFVFLTIESKDTTECRYISSDAPNGDFALFLPRRAKHRYYVDHREAVFYIRTNRKSRDFEVVTADVGNPDESNWRPFIPSGEGRLIEDIDLFKSFAVSVEKFEALNRLRVYNFGTETWKDIPFSEPVYSASPGATPDFNSTTYRYSYQSFITPPSVYEYDTETGSFSVIETGRSAGRLRSASVFVRKAVGHCTGWRTRSNFNRLQKRLSARRQASSVPLRLWFLWDRHVSNLLEQSPEPAGPRYGVRHCSRARR